MTDRTIELQKFHMRLVITPEMGESGAFAYLEQIGRECLDAEREGMGYADLHIETIDHWVEKGAGGEQIARVCFHFMPTVRKE